MTKLFCDVCGVEIPEHTHGRIGSDGYVSADAQGKRLFVDIRVSTEKLETGGPTKGHICYGCIWKAVDSIKPEVAAA